MLALGVQGAREGHSDSVSLGEVVSHADRMSHPLAIMST